MDGAWGFCGWRGWQHRFRAARLSAGFSQGFPGYSPLLLWVASLCPASPLSPSRLGPLPATSAVSAVTLSCDSAISLLDVHPTSCCRAGTGLHESWMLRVQSVSACVCVGGHEVSLSSVAQELGWGHRGSEWRPPCRLAMTLAVKKRGSGGGGWGDGPAGRLP